MSNDQNRGKGGFYIEDEEGRRVPAATARETEQAKPSAPAATSKKAAPKPPANTTRKGEK